MARHESIEHLVRLLDPNPNLPGPLYNISAHIADLRDVLLGLGVSAAPALLPKDGPELTTGLRKLLEAKDCFVRQALIDSGGLDK
jgi:hypothetical protein